MNIFYNFRFFFPFFVYSIRSYVIYQNFQWNLILRSDFLLDFIRYVAIKLQLYDYELGDFLIF